VLRGPASQCRTVGLSSSTFRAAWKPFRGLLTNPRALLHAPLRTLDGQPKSSGSNGDHFRNQQIRAHQSKSLPGSYPHVPASQVFPGKQGKLHRPQLSGSICVLVQLSEQHCQSTPPSVSQNRPRSLGPQPLPTQLPFTQATPAGQAVKQLPQLWGSLLKSTQNAASLSVSESPL
jgi:hypothetical protein